MSPGAIVDRAAQKGIDIIAVTDHNHTGHAKLARTLGAEKGIWVVYGAEVNTREEVHCLTFFDTDVQLDLFQAELERNLTRIPNDQDLFGVQVLVDREERILSEISHSLYPGLDWGITETARVVHELGGLFVPAHVDRSMNGLYRQLGMLPADLEMDGVEISRRTNSKTMLEHHPELAGYQLLQNSDAHFVDDIGRSSSQLLMKERSFNEFCMALRGQSGRKVELG
jgi:PHP family Zn ribbon phosphoesterase